MKSSKPSRLKKGDTIGIAAPARYGEEKIIQKCITYLNKEGYNVKLAENIYTTYGYLAGKDRERAEALMKLWQDPKIKAIWCYAGGYGSARILDYLDMAALPPKIFLGFSDVTALHLALGVEQNLITFLGPTVTQEFGNTAFKTANGSYLESLETLSHVSESKEYAFFPDSKIFKEGSAQGVLVGGNLAIICSLLGTKWQICSDKRVLILEDINEPPYKIDRMLNQLRQAGLFKNPAAIVLASFANCEPEKNPANSLTLDEIFFEYFSDIHCPVIYGFPNGHISSHKTLPLGALVSISTHSNRLDVLETVVQ